MIYDLQKNYYLILPEVIIIKSMKYKNNEYLKYQF